jgi:hypothetical protein
VKATITVIALLAWASTVGAEVHDAGGVVHVATDAPKDSVTVGQRFPVAYRLTAPDSLTFVVPSKIDAGKCRVVSMAWHDTSADGKLEHAANVFMVPVALDSVSVPPVSFDFVSPHGDTLRAWSDGFDVPIRRIALMSEEPRPLKSQWEVPPDYAKWGAIALAALALAAVVVWWVRKRRARLVDVVPEMRLPPDTIALAELEKIAAMGLVERGEFKSYYTLVSDVVRRYLGARFGVETMDRTTHELLDDLSRRRRDVHGLEAWLNEADLVKFAKLKPEAPAALRALEAARAIVVETTPHAEPAVQAARGTG